MLDRLLGFAVYVTFSVTAVIALFTMPLGSWFEMSVLLGIIHTNLLILDVHKRG